MTDLSATASERRVAELLQQVDQPEVSAAELLCDRHPTDAVAFTVVEQDLSSVDLTYGQLRETSERVAAALAGLGVGPGSGAWARCRCRCSRRSLPPPSRNGRWQAERR